MHAVLTFLKTTVVGGLFFLLPVAVAIYVLAKVLTTISRMLAPLADALPFRRIVGFAVADILGVLALVAACFLAGLLARTEAGTRVGRFAEEAILKKVPGYTLLRSMTRDGTLGPGTRVQPALARLEDAWCLAFVVERHADGLLTVFVPSAPTPAAGTIYYLTEDRVRLLDIPVGVAVKLVMQLGVGSAEVMRGRIDPKA